MFLRLFGKYALWLEHRGPNPAPGPWFEVSRYKGDVHIFVGPWHGILSRV